MDWVELGFVYNSLPILDIENWSADDVLEQDIMFLNAKLNIIKETEGFPAIAVGAENFFAEDFIDSVQKNKFEWHNAYFENDIDDYRGNSFFISFSKTVNLFNLSQAIITFGTGSGRFQPTHDGNDMFEGIFFSFDTNISDNFRFLLEEDGYNINSAIQYNFKNFKAKLGLYRIDELATWNPHPRIAFSMQYSFDLFSKIGKNIPQNSLFFKLLNKGRGNYSYYNPNFALNTSLEKELKRIQERRQKAEKELEELKKLLKE